MRKLLVMGFRHISLVRKLLAQRQAASALRQLHAGKGRVADLTAPPPPL